MAVAVTRNSCVAHILVCVCRTADGQCDGADCVGIGNRRGRGGQRVGFNWDAQDVDGFGLPPVMVATDRRGRNVRACRFACLGLAGATGPGVGAVPTHHLERRATFSYSS